MDKDPSVWEGLLAGIGLLVCFGAAAWAMMNDEDDLP
jgi:ABC-type transporter Mla subunit MlaD